MPSRLERNCQVPSSTAALTRRTTQSMRRDPRAARLRAARAVLVRPGRWPPGRHHPALQHGDHRRHQRRLSLRRDGPRAALRRPPGDRRHARRPRPGGLRDRRAQPPRADPARHLAAGLQARAAAAAAPASAARRRQRGLDPAAVRRAVRRPSRDRPARGRRRQRPRDLHVPPQLDHRRVDGARDEPRAPQRRGAVPVDRPLPTQAAA